MADKVKKKNFKFYGASWCGDCRRVEFFLTQNGYSKEDYEYIDIDDDPLAALHVEDVNPNGYRSIPVLEFDNGEILIEPAVSEVAEKLGL